MSTRSVRLDDEADIVLEDIIKRTGMSISDAIKQGLIAYHEIAMANALKRPADFFAHFELGEGGHTIGAARTVKSLLKDKIKKNIQRNKK